MALIEIFIPGTPKPQPRPRAYRRGNHAGVYNPDTADAWKQAVTAAVTAAVTEHRPNDLVEGPVSCLIKFVFARPKRLQRQGDPEGEILHTSTPDADNLAKAVLDVCTGLVWKDDGQVADLYVRKCYAAKSDPRAGARLIVMELGGNSEGILKS